MTATAMPLASVWVMILLTSPSMAALLGIVCETTATGRQQAARSTVKSGKFFRVAMDEQVLSELDPEWLQQGNRRSLLNVYADSRNRGERSPLSRSCKCWRSVYKLPGWKMNF